jgi:hypothetical protein
MAEEGTRCEFYESGWNDAEQKNYWIYECNHKENVGGRGGSIDDRGILLDIFHTSRMYSCWHKNEGMTFRCFGDPEKMKQCPLAKLLN